MTDLLEWLENSSNVQNDILNWETVKENALEKERYQIINDFQLGIISTKYPKIKPVDYYLERYYNNQTYNQKQHIIDIMKADEEDGLYNQNK